MSSDNKALASLNVTAELGSHIAKAAREAVNERKSKAVVERVQALIETQEKAEESIAVLGMVRDHAKARLAAIDAGEFSILGNGAIVYNDPELNKTHKTLPGNSVVDLG
jgi:UDP-N-acetyl-D-mannosaminuronate dehydrogenase